MKEAKEIKQKKQRKPARSIGKKKKKQRGGWPEDLRWAEPAPRENDDDREEDSDNG